MRYCIRILGSTPDRDYFLAVPPIPRGTPNAVRVTILEYVLRRQYTYAAMLAEDLWSDPRNAGTFADVAALISDRPNSSHLNGEAA